MEPLNIRQEATTERQLPADVEPALLNTMLQNEQCAICGHAAPEGSEEFECISALLNKEETEESEESIAKKHCARLFKHFDENATMYKQVMQTIDTSIADEIGEINSLQKSVREYKSKADEISRAFEGLIREDRSDEVVKEAKQHSDNRDKYKKEVDLYEQRLSDLETELEEKKREKDDLVVGNPDATTALKSEVFDNLHKLASSTRDLVFTDVVNELQEKANSMFQAMTKQNQAITGKLRLKKNFGFARYLQKS